MKRKLMDLRDKFVYKLTDLMIDHPNMTCIALAVLLVVLLAAGSDAPAPLNQ